MFKVPALGFLNFDFVPYNDLQFVDPWTAVLAIYVQLPVFVPYSIVSTWLGTVTRVGSCRCIYNSTVAIYSTGTCCVKPNMYH